MLGEYVAYYNFERPHRGLNLEPPLTPRRDAPVGTGPIRTRPVLGGLHHIYDRAAWSRQPFAALQRWESCSLRYFDSRGITRLYKLEAEPVVYRFVGDTPGFSQRFTGTISGDGNSIAGLAELCEDGTTWQQDLWVTYTRVR
jgi:hypothetical protein